MKKQKGITLIALVITIIVLLILAGLTINLTLGERGIFRTAQKAAQNYQNAGQEEMYGLNTLQNEINDILGGLGPNNTTPNVAVTNIEIISTVTSIEIGETAQLTATILPENATNKNITWNSSNTGIATVAQDRTVTAVGEGTTTITATAQDGSNVQGSCTITVTYPTLASKVEPGDYVEYDGGNGYTGKWQVLYNDSTYGLQIISSALVNESYTLGGSTEAEAKASYNNAVNTLNAACRNYVNGSYATSGRCVGSNPLSSDDNPTTMDKVTLQFTYNGSTASGCVVGDTENKYLIDYNAMQAATKRNTGGIHNLGKNYWLASRNVISYTNYAHFFVRGVNLNGYTYNDYLWYVNSNGNSNPRSGSFGLRPVITLKSGIQTSSGDGSESTPFKLVPQ